MPVSISSTPVGISPGVPTSFRGLQHHSGASNIVQEGPVLFRAFQHPSRCTHTPRLSNCTAFDRGLGLAHPSHLHSTSTVFSEHQSVWEYLRCASHCDQHHRVGLDIVVHLPIGVGDYVGRALAVGPDVQDLLGPWLQGVFGWLQYSCKSKMFPFSSKNSFIAKHNVNENVTLGNRLIMPSWQNENNTEQRNCILYSRTGLRSDVSSLTSLILN